MRAARVLAPLLALPAAALSALAVQRARLPYNSEGRYFDATDSVIYHDGTALVYGMLAGGFALAALALLRVGRRK